MLNGIPRILIIRLSAIGDVVRALPALHALRRAYPNAQIDWAVERKSADIVIGHPELDQILVFERPEGTFDAIKAFRAFCQTVKAGRYDMVVDFHGLAKSGLMAWASKAPKRYGFRRPRAQECSSFFTNRRVKLPSQNLNRVEENLLLAEAAGGDISAPRGSIFITQEAQEHVDAFFELTFEGAKVVVAMHAPVDRPEKQWPLEHFGELADMLLADGRFDVMLTWGPGQQDIAHEVMSYSRRKPVLAPETPDLKYHARLMQRSHLYVGGDTGPMHIAAMVDTPVVGIFGGTDPAKHRPYQRPAELLYIPPKGSDLKADAAKRLAQISPEMVYDACVKLLFRSD